MHEWGVLRKTSGCHLSLTSNSTQWDTRAMHGIPKIPMSKIHSRKMKTSLFCFQNWPLYWYQNRVTLSCMFGEILNKYFHTSKSTQWATRAMHGIPKIPKSKIDALSSLKAFGVVLWDQPQRNTWDLNYHRKIHVSIEHIKYSQKDHKRSILNNIHCIGVRKHSNDKYGCRPQIFWGWCDRRASVYGGCTTAIWGEMNRLSGVAHLLRVSKGRRGRRVTTRKSLLKTK